VTNLILFNLAWLGLVLLGNVFIPVAMCWLAIHVYQQKERKKEILILLCVASIGITVDSLLTQVGVFTFDEPTLIPFWLITLWFCFAATINHSMHFLSKHRGLQVFFGMLAPVSYLAGERFDKVEMPLGLLPTFVALAILWMVLMLFFYAVRKRIVEQEYLASESS